MNDVVIEKLVVGGKGLGRLKDGMVVLVPFVIPGERVRVQAIKKKKTFQEACLTEVLHPSPDRVTPVCPYFGQCGGCHFQHISDTRQDVLKKDIFSDEFHRSGLRFDKSCICYLSSPRTLGYRQRIRLHVHDGKMGFFYQLSHTLLEIDQCLLARQEINTVLHQLASNDHWLQVAEHVNEVEIHVNPADGMCLLITHFNRTPRPRDLTSLQEIVAGVSGLSSLLVKTSNGALHTSIPDKIFSIGYVLRVEEDTSVEINLEPGGFCQVNVGQNQQMVDQALSWLQDEPRGRLLDLFCGVGNFSLPLARSGFVVTGIDQQRSAIRSALQNNHRNNLTCDFLRSAAHSGLKQIVDEGGGTFDYVLLDPPRAGFKEGSTLLPKLHASKMIYISCDQATLFRDLKTICAEGYEISAITLVDQFCQSYHLESMVLLTRM